jgi:hypothetical protein
MGQWEKIKDFKRFYTEREEELPEDWEKTENGFLIYTGPEDTLQDDEEPEVIYVYKDRPDEDEERGRQYD